MNHEPGTHRGCSSGLILGIGVILLGVVLLLEQVPGLRDSLVLEFVKSLWPLILVAMGAARVQRGDDKHPARGWSLIAVGFILLIATLGHGRFDELIAPALVLGAGIFIVLRTLRHQRLSIAEFRDSEDFIRGTAVLSGFKQRVRAQAFKGGELTAIFGGFDLDLRQVVLEGDSARIDVFLMFGGGEIRVPEDWDVAIQATAIAGGVSDKSTPMLSASERHPRLIVTGLILFGGVEVKR